ncbi:MAG: RNA polymerase sigma-70 factor [Chitinophagaceae bacterium]|mgnify:FL=1|nr:RNA polymerase sigma-70 factor [Chitinophagaceae bacterium]MBK8311895.1 RNA polymerase sigma-70 factor [Chitinophagaceae bacterium]MBP6477689.1 RNA polymerase sigma-70 factor [Chitinophagaceae bacterium]MBP7107391.1 RNA polymerase sigma-70 factor [Chitinophagaceae bacterium]MBP7314712.1 RNA polymerase sigma-70 factor [Chitinophagaceae bacterium]
MTENDEIKRLLSAIAFQNDQAAYKELFILLHNRLKQFGYAILKSNEEAEELVSDIFIKVWEKKEKLTTIESPLLYFYTTAKNLAFNRLQKQKRLQSLKPEEWLMQVNSIYLNPEELMMTAEMLNKIKRAVNDLPPRCKLIFKLVKEDGLKYREVAELLQLSVKTVEAQMAIALRRLGKCMHIELKTAAVRSLH